MELVLNKHGHRRLLHDLLGNGKDRCFRCGDRLLRTTDGDVCDVLAIVNALKIDLSFCIVLDLINGCTSFAENASNAAVRNGEVEDVVCFLFKLQSLGSDVNESQGMEIKGPAYVK